MDGELAQDDEVFDALKRDGELRDSWQKYCLIGEALKGETRLSADITARVMSELSGEPVVLAPRRSSRAEWQRSVLAIAATLAGVAVVGWVALAPSAGQKTNAPLAQSSAQQRAAVQAVVAQAARPASRDMQEYLVAHQAQSSSLQFRGGTEYIRTVAASRMMPAK